MQNLVLTFSCLDCRHCIRTSLEVILGFTDYHIFTAALITVLTLSRHIFYTYLQCSPVYLSVTCIVSE